MPKKEIVTASTNYAKGTFTVKMTGTENDGSVKRFGLKCGANRTKVIAYGMKDISNQMEHTNQQFQSLNTTTTLAPIRFVRTQSMKMENLLSSVKHPRI